MNQIIIWRFSVLTMFVEIFENRLLEESQLLALGHMQVKIDENAPEKDSQVAYLYKLVALTLSKYFADLCQSL